MSDEALQDAQAKMAKAGVDQTAIDVFGHYYRELEAGATGLIREDDIRPMQDPPMLDDLEVDEETAREALAKAQAKKPTLRPLLLPKDGSR